MSNPINTRTFGTQNIQRVNTRAEREDIGEGERHHARNTPKREPGAETPLTLQDGVAGRHRLLEDAFRNLNMALLVIESVLLLLQDLLKLSGETPTQAQIFTLLDQPLGKSHITIPYGEYSTPTLLPVPLLEQHGVAPYVITLHPIDVDEVQAGSTTGIEEAIKAYREDHIWIETQMVELLGLGLMEALEDPEALAADLGDQLRDRLSPPWNEYRLRKAARLLRHIRRSTD